MGHLLSNVTFGFLIVFVRISSAVMTLPGFSEAGVPTTVRIGLSVALTAIIAPLVSNILPTIPMMPAGTILVILQQIVIGVGIGWIARTILMSLPFAGQAISYQIGLSSVLLPSMDLGPGSTLVSVMFNLLVPVLFFSTTLFLFPILALVNSFHDLPATTAVGFSHHFSAVLLVKVFIRAIAFELTTAAQIAAPFLVIGLIWQAGLALTARASPQLQIFFVAAPLQILVGLILLALFLHPILSVWQRATTHALAQYVPL